MALVYGLTGIKQRSYRVWLVYPTSGSEGLGMNTVPISMIIGFIETYMSEYKYGLVYNEISALLSGNDDISISSEKLGECRKDSISLTCEDGESIEGNEVGTIVLGKNCTFTCELINATPENILQLENYVDSKIPVYIVLEEIESNTKDWPTGEEAPNDIVESFDTHELIFIGINEACVINSAESHTGGGISTVTITIADTVPKIGDFRAILDVPYDLDNVVSE